MENDAIEILKRNATEAGWDDDSKIFLLCEWIDTLPDATRRNLDMFLQEHVEYELEQNEKEELEEGEAESEAS